MSDDLLPYFLAEGRELVERAAEGLLDLERGTGAADAVERVFRALHTLKGSAALFDFAELTALMHAAESRMEEARDAGGAPAPEVLTVLQSCIAETELWLDALSESGEVAPARREAAVALKAALGDKAAGAARPAPAGIAAPAPVPQIRSLRIDAAELDAASGLLDELSVAASRFAYEAGAALGGRIEAAGVAEARFALEQSLTALRASMGRLRLAPLRMLFGRLPRQVREMAATLGKPAELTTAGEHIALDKAILDGLYEPLIHLLRNAVDHGLEAPERRRAAGKPALGHIRLTASARGGDAVIELCDDGAGLDLARIRETAVKKGLLDAEAAQALSDREAADLIFRPGFSTARALTDLSGRGVGLDAVRSALAAIGGRIEMESEPGRGATARIFAPLRTLVTRVAVISVGGERFGTPLDQLHEIVRVAASDVTAVRAGEAFVRRGEVLPLVRLAPRLGLAPEPADPLTVLIVSAPSGRIGVAVDRVLETLQAPIQAASPLLAALPGVTGSLMEGEGRILLLIDLAALTA